MARSWTRAIPVVVAATVVVAGAVTGFSRAQDPVRPSEVVVAATDPAPAEVSGAWTATAVSATPTSFTVADAAGPTVRLFEAPDVPLASKPSMDNPTHEGLAVVFLVLEEDGPWLKVRVSSRPNHLVAWVLRSEVTLRTVKNRIVVEVGARRATVYHGDDVLLETVVAVGTEATPTPLGEFFVDGVVKVPYDTGPYGAYQVSVSGFSEVLHSFSGGNGQIALHGTNRPDLLGQPVSNGCVRMDNAAITSMAWLAPTGTPVQIVA